LELRFRLGNESERSVLMDRAEPGTTPYLDGLSPPALAAFFGRCLVTKLPASADLISIKPQEASHGALAKGVSTNVPIQLPRRLGNRHFDGSRGARVDREARVYLESDLPNETHLAAVSARGQCAGLLPDYRSKLCVAGSRSRGGFDPWVLND
jgi:hypothetical protein